MRGCEVVGLMLGLKWVQSASKETDTFLTILLVVQAQSGDFIHKEEHN
jgi:hypothetical protein